MRFIALLLLLLSAPGLGAQLPDYHLQYFDYSSGIRPGTIESLQKDKEGFMWIVYPRSVQRFDGQQVRDFKPGKVVINLHVDAKGRRWMAVQGGVMRFNTARQQFEQVALQTDKPPANRDVFEMPDGSIWLAAAEHFYRYHEAEDRFKPVPNLLPVPPPYGVRSFAVKGNTLFITRRSLIYRYNTASRQLDSLPNPDSRRVFAMTEDSVMVTSWNIESYWYNFSRKTVSRAAPPDLGTRPFGVRSMVHTDSGRYLIASQQGMYAYHAQTGRFKKLVIYNKGEQVNAIDFVQQLYTDDEGYVWAASIDGVARFPAKGQLFGLIRMAQQVNGYPAGVNNIRAMTEDNEGNLWMATGNGFVGWNRMRNQLQIFLPHENDRNRLAYPSVRGIAWDGRYLILAPADKGVWLYHPKTKAFRRPVYASDYVKQLSEQDFFDGLTTLRNGNFVLCGRDALYQLKGKTYILDTVSSPASGENTNYAYQGADGWVWITTTRGLHLFDANMHYRQRVALPGGPQSPSAAFVMKDNALLLAADSGVMVLRYVQGNISMRKFTSALDGKFLTNLYLDNKGILWATSDDGIYRYDDHHKRLNLFDYTDNVQGYGFNLNSWWRSADGTLFLGGINGLNYVQPDQFTGHLQPPPVKITSFRPGNDSMIYQPVPGMKIPWQSRNVSVSFVSPWYNNTAKLHYRYRLSDLDKTWHDVGNLQELRFADLEPGHYTLLIESSLNRADWTPMEQPLQFTILHPFYRTWWFYLLVAALGAGLLYLLLKTRQQRVRRKEEQRSFAALISQFSPGTMKRSEPQLLEELTRQCVHGLGLEKCVVYLPQHNQELVPAAGFQLHPSAEPYPPLPMSNTQHPVVQAANMETSWLPGQPPSFGHQQGVAVPMVSDGKVLGVIHAIYSKDRPFTQPHLQTLHTLASLCAGNMVKARTEAEKQQAEQHLMATKQQLAEIEMQALRAQMNPHFIFNCLNSINRYIVKSDQATASLYLTRFAKLIRLILDNSNNKTVSLSNELEALRLYIDMESIRFEKQFTYSITVEEGLDTEALQVPPMIIQPFVENAIWHGLLHLGEPGELKVEIASPTPGIIECRIIDNGVGRAKARELKSKSAAQRKSLGMKITEDRLALLHQSAKQQRIISVQDLYHADGSAAGTTVILSIPVDV